MKTCRLRTLFLNSKPVGLALSSVRVGKPAGNYLLKILCVFLLVVGSSVIEDLQAIAQDTRQRELERVEINPPARRATPRRAAPARGSGSGETNTSEQTESTPPADARAGARGAGSGLLSTLPGLSVVRDKSTVSTSATSLPSQVQIINRQDIEGLVARDVPDLLKQVAGMTATTFGQGDIGAPFEMRGFFGQHGADIGIFVDGVPQNWPFHTEHQGAADIAYLTPEMIERIEIIKGPFSALYGNFALAGVVNIITRNYQHSQSLTVTGGTFGAYRGVGIFSSDRWIPTPFLVNELYRTEGYRNNSSYKRWSPFNKVSFPVWGGNLSLRLNYFTSTWGAPGYIGLEDLRKGLVDPVAAINPQDGGSQGRYSFVMNYSPLCGEAGLYATAYVENYQPVRFATFQSNPPPIPAPPITQWNAVDDRTHWGGRIYYNFVFCNFASLIAGGETRQDKGSSATYDAIDREIIKPNYRYDLRLSNWAWFLQGQLRIADSVKLVGGVRRDWFRYYIDNTVNPANSGVATPIITSPKAGIVITPREGINIFANKGFGFRTPTAQELSPVTGPAGFNLQPAVIDTFDAGCNMWLFDSLYLAVAGYQTYFQKEIVTINDTPKNVGNTKREGYEVEGKFYASKDVLLFANVGWVDAKVVDPTVPGQTLVPQTSEWIVKGGIQITKDFWDCRRLRLDAYYNYLSAGPNYLGNSPIPYYGSDYDAYFFKLTYTEPAWSAFIGAKLQPRRLASDFYNTTSNQLTLDPKPLWDVTECGFTCNFW